MRRLSGSGGMGETRLHYRATAETALRAISGGAAACPVSFAESAASAC